MWSTDGKAAEGARGAIVDELHAADWVPPSVRAKPRSVERAIAGTLYHDEDLMPADIGQALGYTESRVCQIHTEVVLQLCSRINAANRETCRSVASVREGSRLPVRMGHGPGPGG